MAVRAFGGEPQARTVSGTGAWEHACTMHLACAQGRKARSKGGFGLDIVITARRGRLAGMSRSRTALRFAADRKL
ncbi:MAG: hypothetical protein NVSMB25_02980 [Thermoleophilaceae bacterium]